MLLVLRNKQGRKGGGETEQVRKKKKKGRKGGREKETVKISTYMI